MSRPKRKNIPVAVKRQVMERQRHHCAECRTIFTTGCKVEYDHRPALWMRPVNEAGTDYIPAQLDPAYIDALHAPGCHLKRTVGRAIGAEKTVTTKGSDAHLKAKFDRLEGRTKTRPKQKIPSRPFPKGRGFERRRDQ